MTVVDLFAGVGGWDHGARTLGIDPIGIELDDDACRSRALSEMPTIQADIAAYPTERFAGIDGLIVQPRRQPTWTRRPARPVGVRAAAMGARAQAAMDRM